MDASHIRRREFIRLVMTATLIPVVGCSKNRTGGVSSPGKLERYRAEPGSLHEHEMVVLVGLFEAVRAHWKLQEMRHFQIERVLKLKAEHAPSYLAEYKSAVTLFESFPDRWRETLGTNKLKPGPLQHAREFVVLEMARLAVVGGGYRDFGFRNHNGAPAGPLVFRSLEESSWK